LSAYGIRSDTRDEFESLIERADPSFREEIYIQNADRAAHLRKGSRCSISDDRCIGKLCGILFGRNDGRYRYKAEGDERS
jgi:hypothetical protein